MLTHFSQFVSAIKVRTQASQRSLRVFGLRIVAVFGAALVSQKPSEFRFWVCGCLQIQQGIAGSSYSYISLLPLCSTLQHLGPAGPLQWLVLLAAQKAFDQPAPGQQEEEGPLCSINLRLGRS